MGDCWFPRFQVSLCFLLMTLCFSLHTITTTIITKSSLKSSPLLSYLYYHRPNKSILKKNHMYHACRYYTGNPFREKKKTSDKTFCVFIWRSTSGFLLQYECKVPPTPSTWSYLSLPVCCSWYPEHQPPQRNHYGVSCRILSWDIRWQTQTAASAWWPATLC